MLVLLHRSVDGWSMALALTILLLIYLLLYRIVVTAVWSIGAGGAGAVRGVVWCCSVATRGVASAVCLCHEVFDDHELSYVHCEYDYKYNNTRIRMRTESPINVVATVN